MLRRVLAALALCGLLTAVVLADEFNGTVKKIDAEQRTVTLQVGGEEKTLPVSADAEVFTQAKLKNKLGPKIPVRGGLAAVKPDTEVSVVTIKTRAGEKIASLKVEPKKK